MLFRWERRGFQGILVLVILMLALFLTAPLWQSEVSITACRSAVKGLAATCTAFHPSGSLFRHPGAKHRGVDLRYSPYEIVPSAGSDR